MVYFAVVDKREIIPPLDLEHQKHVRDYVDSARKQLYELISPVIITAEQISPEIIAFQNQLDIFNQKRAEYYNQPYTSPEVFYIDRIASVLHRDQLILKIDKPASREMFYQISNNGGVTYSLTNTVIVPINNFTVPKLDEFIVAYVLRHEMSHAGSSQKIQVTLQGETPEEWMLNVQASKIGGISLTYRGKKLGLAIDEGHRHIEDSWQVGRLSDRIEIWSPRFYNNDTVSQKFPIGWDMNNELVSKLTQDGLLLPGSVLTCVLDTSTPDQESYKPIFGKDYSEYLNLMATIYDHNPKLFRLVEDYIYGSCFIPFAKEISNTFGPQFLRKLFTITNPGEALLLTQDIT